MLTEKEINTLFRNMTVKVKGKTYLFNPRVEELCNLAKAYLSLVEKIKRLNPLLYPDFVNTDEEAIVYQKTITEIKSFTEESGE